VQAKDDRPTLDPDEPALVKLLREHRPLRVDGGNGTNAVSVKIAETKCISEINRMLADFASIDASG